jgi:lysophospholipase L1-like esterase
MRLGWLTAMTLVAVSVTAGALRAEAQGGEPFLEEILAFEAADQTSPPPACADLFVGSSSFRLWSTLADDMAPRTVINRGFGGSQMSELNGWFDRLVAPYRPRAILVYEGENDINAGESAEQVAADLEAFMAMKTEALGATPVYFVSIKPSKLRWSQRAEQVRANGLIGAMAEARGDLAFIDVGAAMLENGAPKDIFVEDDLHMTAAGYALWTPIIRAALEEPPESTAPGC